MRRANEALQEQVRTAHVLMFDVRYPLCTGL